MIKALPEDFIVEEKADLPLRAAGEFRVYVLRKNHWNTLDLVGYLSRLFRIPNDRFSYGGKKDKHGLTSQFIAVRDTCDLSRSGKGFSLQSVGFMDRAMGPDFIRGNAFTITVRDLDETESIDRNIREVEQTGFPNFFDDQRFRSYDPERGFFAEKILKRHWNGALQVFLTSAARDASKKERERKAGILESWKDWPRCLALAQSRLEQRIFRYLSGHPRNFAAALHLIPEEEISMQYAAFQSHLWNELLRRLIRLKVEDYREVRGKEGGYLFWRRLDPSSLAYFQSLEIPTAALKTDFPDSLTRKLADKILEEKGLRDGMFRTKALSRVYFRSFLRKALLTPDDIRVTGLADDELHRGKKKLTLSFSLPRGAYATILIKRLEL